MPSKMKTCEDHRTELIDAAADGIESSLEFRAHLDDCTYCRAALIEERRLYAAIDTGVRVTANAEVPPSLLPRVRAQLQRNVSRSAWVPTGTAVAAAVVLMVVVVLARDVRRDSAGANPDAHTMAGKVLPGVRQPASRAPATLLKMGRPPKPKSGPTGSDRDVAQPKELLVLIPPGQKRAIGALLASVPQNRVETNISPVEKSEGALRELQVAPLVISPIEVKPLAEVSLEPASEDAQTSHREF